MHRLLLQLLNHFLYAGTMFFAAADTGLSGASSTGNESVVGADVSGDVGDEGGDTADVAADTSSETSDSDVAETTADKSVDLGNGRSVPAKWKKAFDVAKQNGVEKEFKQLYFASERLNKAIPGGVNGAIELAKAVEQFGGVEGVQQLQSDLETYHADSELFERGDPKWIETAFSESPEIALKHFANSLDYVADKHPEHYDHLMSKVIFNDMRDNSPLGATYEFLKSLGDNPKAQELKKAIADYWNARRDTAQKVPEKKIDAQTKQLSERETAVEQREMGVRFTQVNAQIHPVMKSQVTKSLQAEAKAVGIDLQKLSKDYPGEWRDMLNAIHKKIMQEATKDARFIDKYYALVKKGDLKRAAASINSKHEAIVPNIVREISKQYGLFRGKKTATTGKETVTAKPGNNAAGWTFVAARPGRTEIDWEKTTPAMQMDGQYILNDGKRVQVRY